MQKALHIYKKLLLLLRERGRSLPPPQKQALIRKILAIEQIMIQFLVGKMLTGGLDLNISKLPPRLQRLVRLALNRRLHIIYTLEKIQQRQKKHEKEKKKELERISFALLKESGTNGLGNLSGRFSSFAEENEQKRGNILQRLRGRQL
ncbi:MAG: hypothetical protein O3A66_02875 [Proteobacteria bacterium]|jgi:hypothetical protein|nr:hypothetical protein [Pseudomonadota bacterium]